MTAELIRDPRRLTRFGLLALAILALGLPFYLGYFPADLAVYLHGGTAVRGGLDLYSYQVGRFGFTYPPFPALLAALPSLLPRWLAAAAMAAASLYALQVLVRHSAPSLLRAAGASTAALLGLLLLVACEPVRITLWNGQVNLILAALTVYDLQRPATARTRGALVGICTGVKLTPGIFVVYLLACRRYRDARNAALGFGATVAGSWLVLPSDSREYWTHYVFGTSRIGDIRRWGNQSLLAVSDRLLSSTQLATLVWIAAAAAVLAGGCYLAARLSSRDPILAIGVVGITGCLVSPVSWTHHWVWFVPLIAGLFRFVQERGRAAQAGLLALALLVVVGCNKPPFSLAFHWGVTAWTLGNGYVIAALAVLVALAVNLRRAGPGRRALSAPRALRRAADVPVRTSGRDAG
ncbi:MAG: glycosyltransferase 87 family protein [Jatrophihabitantaceae bacterium]